MLADEILQKLLESFPGGTLVPIHVIHEGLSGAQVLLVDIQTKGELHQTGLAFAKIDRTERSTAEFTNHSYIQTSAIADFVPSIIIDAPIGPVNGWSLVLYQPAVDTIFHSISLTKAIDSHEYSVNQLANQIDLLIREVLDPFYKISDPVYNRKLCRISDLFRELINIGGISHFSSLDERARTYGFTGEQHLKLILLPGDVVLPNPFAYLLDPTIWKQVPGVDNLVCPIAPIHGDLHGGNIICQLNSQKHLRQRAPWLIDFALFQPKSVPFFDLAYLELDTLLRVFPVGSEQQWKDWLYLIQFITSSVLPLDNPRGLHSSVAWTAIQPIRNYLSEMLAQIGSNTSGIDEQFEAVWWLVSTVIGVRFARRSKENLIGQRKLALVYAAYSLQRLLALLSLKVSEQVPFPVQWQEGQAKLTLEIIRSYTEGIFREQRKALLQQTTHLEAEIQINNLNSPLEVSKKLMDILIDDLFGEVMPFSRSTTDAKVVDNVVKELKQYEQIILLGEPGSGKTTTLKLLTLEYIGDPGANTETLLPVFVPLAQYNPDIPFAIFAESFLRSLKGYSEQLNLVWLLDAFNEMPRRGTITQRDPISEVKEFLQGKKFVLSSRTRDYREELSDLGQIHKIKLRTLNPIQIHQVIFRRLPPEIATELWAEMNGGNALLEAWTFFKDFEDEFWKENECPRLVELRYCGFSELEPEERNDFLFRFENKRWSINFPANYYAHQEARKAIHQDPRQLMLMCRNPYTLGVVIDLAYRTGVGKIPGNRALLFGALVNLLLGREERNAQQQNEPWEEGTEEEIKNILAQLAVSIQNTKTRTTIAQKTVLSTLQSSQFKIEDLLLKAEDASLIRYGDIIQFTHQLLQEYFATSEPRKALAKNENPSRFFPNKWWEVGPWDETIVILSELLQDRHLVTEWIAKENPRLGFKIFQQEAETIQKSSSTTRLRLANGARDKTNERDPMGLVTAWSILGALDMDSRPGIGLTPLELPDIIWCLIPAGEFTLGSSVDDPYALMNEKPQQRIFLHEFRISKYPITQVQFWSFFKSGYTDKKYWSEEGWKWQTTNKRSPIESSTPNFPQVDVSWYEAAAFCAWLTEQYRNLTLLSSSETIHLPTESEWEKAAKGNDDRYYPWGYSFDATHCNMSETGIGELSPVGVFQNGASPNGVMDLSGNIWEWCQSPWRKYYTEQNEELTGPGTFVARVVRGGAYNSSRREVRCTYRHRLLPGGKLFPVGFRIVLNNNSF